jgi:hypothetical protein
LHPYSSFALLLCTSFALMLHLCSFVMLLCMWWRFMIWNLYDDYKAMSSIVESRKWQGSGWLMVSWRCSCFYLFFHLFVSGLWPLSVFNFDSTYLLLVGCISNGVVGFARML